MSEKLTKFLKIPGEVKVKEVQETKQYLEDDVPVQNNNPVASALKVMAFLVYIGGFITGIVMGDAIIYWFVAFFSGTTILGFAEIIQLLNDIKNK